jgi:hypothetical protein
MVSGQGVLPSWLMQRDNLLLLLSIVAVVAAVGASAYTYYSVGSLLGITGLVTTGDAELSIPSNIIINVSTFTINWTEGQVDEGETYATLDTSNNLTTNGNWTAMGTGFIIDNVGTVNVSLEFRAGKSAAAFIGGAGPAYQWNLSNMEANACTAGTGNSLGEFNDTNTSWMLCDPFDFISSADQVELDLNLTIPEDSAPGVKEDTITVVAAAT